MWPQGIGSSNCLAKTQVYTKPKGEVYGLTPAQLEGYEERLEQSSFRICPVSGGRNYNGPKVAKFLVG